MLKQLPYDISRCIPQKNGCEVKNKCARFTSNWSLALGQSAFDGSTFKEGNDKCDWFIDNERDTK